MPISRRRSIRGTVLQVVGKLNRWLKIDRNGREVWLADWVNFSRVESGAPSGSQQPTAQIDNCCFVNRQCATNQEWTDGYWAFQRNECPSGQPAGPVAAPVSAPAGQQIDNCCYVNRQCVTNQEWVAGYMAYQAGQCAAPSQSQMQPSRPRIEGSARFVRVIERTLNLLRDKAPEWYTYVISAIDSIAEIPRVERDNVFCSAFALVASRRVEIETCRLSHAGFSNPIVMAGTLSHEACHIHTYEAGIVFPYGGAQEELECGLPGIAIYKLLDPHRRVVNYITDLDGVLRIANEFCRFGR